MVYRAMSNFFLFYFFRMILMISNINSIIIIIINSSCTGVGENVSDKSKMISKYQIGTSHGYNTVCSFTFFVNKMLKCGEKSAAAS